MYVFFLIREKKYSFQINDNRIKQRKTISSHLSIFTVNVWSPNCFSFSRKKTQARQILKFFQSFPIFVRVPFKLYQPYLMIKQTLWFLKKKERCTRSTISRNSSGNRRLQNITDALNCFSILIELLLINVVLFFVDVKVEKSKKNSMRECCLTRKTSDGSNKRLITIDKNKHAILI